MIWLVHLLGVPCIAVLGWFGHSEWCKRRIGCPVWLEAEAKKWDVKAELNGYHRRKHQAKGPRERHPTLPPVDPEAKP